MEPDELQKLKFEEYKFFVDDTARFTDRRQAVANLYISINSLLVGAMAFLLKDAGLGSAVSVPAILAIVVAGIAICLFWNQLVIKYKALVGLRIKELKKIEDDMSWCHRMYHTEDALYPCDENGDPIQGQGLNISDIERRLPWVFIVLYALFGFVLLLAWMYGMI